MVGSSDKEEKAILIIKNGKIIKDRWNIKEVVLYES